MKIAIAKARLTEVFRIVELLESGREEVASPLPQPEFPYAYQALMNIIAGGGAWVARLENGDLVGVLLAEPNRLWYRRNLHYLQSVEFYVRPEFRKGGTASRLIEKAKQAATEAGVPFILSITSGVRAEIKDRFVEQMGLEYLGGNLVFDPLKALPEAENDDIVAEEG